MEKKDKITHIKYAQMNRDPKIEQVMSEMEELFFGEKGIGLMKQLGLTPGKIQKSLDEQWEEEFDALIEEHKDYIFWETRKRASELDMEWIMGLEGAKIPEEEFKGRMEKSIKQAEVEVIKELVEKHL